MDVPPCPSSPWAWVLGAPHPVESSAVVLTQKAAPIPPEGGAPPPFPAASPRAVVASPHAVMASVFLWLRGGLLTLGKACLASCTQGRLLCPLSQRQVQSHVVTLALPFWWPVTRGVSVPQQNSHVSSQSRVSSLVQWENGAAPRTSTVPVRPLPPQNRGSSAPQGTCYTSVSLLQIPDPLEPQGPPLVTVLTCAPPPRSCQPPPGPHTGAQPPGAHRPQAMSSPSQYLIEDRCSCPCRPRPRSLGPSRILPFGVKVDPCQRASGVEGRTMLTSPLAP